MALNEVKFSLSRTFDAVKINLTDIESNVSGYFRWDGVICYVLLWLVTLALLRNMACTPIEQNVPTSSYFDFLIHNVVGG